MTSLGGGGVSLEHVTVIQHFTYLNSQCVGIRL